MNTTEPELTLQIINITQDEILNTFYKMVDDKAIENNKHTELKNLIQLLDNDTLIKLHLTQNAKYLKYRFNIWRYFETHETRERALNIRMNIINSFSSNIEELNNEQLLILYFPEIDNKKIESINIYDAKIGDIIQTYQGSSTSIYSKIYKITKNYIFLETFKRTTIKNIRYDILSSDTIYIVNFLKLEFDGKIKIFKRNEDDRRPATLNKVKDNITYIITNVYHNSD